MTADADALRAEILRTRAALGQTVEALAAKADVKSRARAAARRTVNRAAAHRTRLLLAAGATLAVGAIAVLASRMLRRP
ncbi:DUF3618 domain-containing protein [Dactylosporangium sp. CA-233914]|uniref:DUF3618 domain-containing protein n=1 Tax=Dactylosporangium sp. CA-233914 TaxID=3239934 RepID=UPI003D8E92CC